MKQTLKKTKAPAPKPWKGLPLSAYRAQCDDLVTHSIKGVNTNATGGGIRVVPLPDPDMPYASVRFGRESVALDYTKNATQPFAASTATEQLDAVRLGKFDRFSGVTPEECADLREQVLPVLEQPHIAADSYVSPRVRQILLDDGQGGDVCLTPLPSGGFSARLHRLVQEARDGWSTHEKIGSSHRSFLDEVAIKVGGDKAQNAGRIHLIGAMQQTYCPSVPADADGDSRDLRTAFALYYRGVSLRLPHALLKDYARFLVGLRQRDERHGASEMRRTTTRLDRESTHMAAMARIICERGDRAHAQIAPYVANGVLPGHASPDLPLIQQGLLDPARRNNDWKTALAQDLAHQIVSAKTRDETLIVGLAGQSIESLQDTIKEVL